MENGFATANERRNPGQFRFRFRFRFRFGAHDEPNNNTISYTTLLFATPEISESER
jgi:hypothetical protein